MDSDGFFRGETLDGRHGLVPSNYVERVPDHIVMGRSNSPSFPLSVPQHLTTICHDFSEPSTSCDQLPDSVCPFPPADVSKVTVQEIKQNDAPRVPCPRDLIVEKKLSRSLVISWSPPEESFVAVSQYHVCVDGQVRAVVPGTYKCRALIEDVSLDHSVNVSVRAVTDQGSSPDQACTVAVGTEAAVAPQHLRVWQVTPVSACVRWLPSNSNAEHVVSLNAVKVGVCPPSVFQVQLQGLTPSTIYRISVRTKHPRAVLEQRPVERCLDFKTLPKIGLPDPPSNVQVEHGPQPGHLLISWAPVTNQPKPPSRAAVAAYLIYADGKNIAQVPSESADHVVLRLADLSDDPPIFITVRTKTREGAVSADSNVARVPRGHLPPVVVNTAASVPAPIVDNSLLLTPAVLPPPPPAGPPSDPMAASYPSFAPTTAYQTAYQPATAPVAPYTAPPMLQTSAMPFQPSQYSAPGGYAMYERVGSLQRGMTAAALANVPMATTTLPGAPVASVHGHGSLQGTLPKWKSQPPMSQYYTFHPTLLREGAPDEARPSVLEMENSYLLRHRQSEWAGPSLDGRARAEMYARGIRVGSADQAPRHRLVPPRLARVKSETGFGTRSEPDLRPPTLDDDCRWFVALFDYSHHMSPNANAEMDELSFRKHQLIKVYGEADADGFYHGQINGRYGFVPSNMVIEIDKNDILPIKTRMERGGVEALAAEPALRRTRWGSVKSRSYDHAGDRRSHDRPGASYASLDRRDDRRDRDQSREPSRDRYRRSNGREYDYRREYDDQRYREPPRDRRDEYYEDEYRDKYRFDRERDRDYERRDHDDRRRRDDDRFRRERREEFRDDRGYDYPPQEKPRYEANRSPSQVATGSHMGTMGSMGANHVGHLGQQMSQMQLSQVPSSSQLPQMAMVPSTGPMANSSFPGYQGMASRQVIAKYDFDAKQSSPNVDAEQVELSFRQGDVITIYGEKDEDGFYVGEINGQRGLVPSNFLQESPLTSLAPSLPSEPMQMRKGVAFSDGQAMTGVMGAKKPVPVRQTSQTSTATSATTKPVAKKSIAGAPPGKTLSKKASDVGKNSTTSATRKTSTAVKKNDATAKKK